MLESSCQAGARLLAVVSNAAVANTVVAGSPLHLVFVALLADNVISSHLPLQIVKRGFCAFGRIHALH